MEILVFLFTPVSITYNQSSTDNLFIRHVSIRWANIERGREDNFAKYSRSEVSTLQLPYDTESILHYSPNAFSRLVAARAPPVYWPVKGLAHDHHVTRRSRDRGADGMGTV